jgi:hypothetical protein
VPEYDNVKVPEEVTGLPDTVNIEGAASPTLVTVPPVEEIVMVLPEGVIVIPVPATSVNAPVKPLRLVTPPPPPPKNGYDA